MHYCGDFPAVVVDNDGFPLKGELYKLDEVTLKLMDVIVAIQTPSNGANFY